VRALIKCLEDLSAHVVEREELMRPEAHYPPAAAFEPVGPDRVAGLPVVAAVRIAVDLDDQDAGRDNDNPLLTALTPTLSRERERETASYTSVVAASSRAANLRCAAARRVGMCSVGHIPACGL
jgi:hypothetical protein